MCKYPGLGRLLGMIRYIRSDLCSVTRGLAPTTQHFILFALPLIVTSCSSDRPARLVQSRSASENTVQPEAAFRLEATRVADLRPIDRKLIRSGDLRVQVGSVQTASQRADSIATQYGR